MSETTCPTCGAPAKHIGYTWADDSSHSPKDGDPLHKRDVYAYALPAPTVAALTEAEARIDSLESALIGVMKICREIGWSTDRPNVAPWVAERLRIAEELLATPRASAEATR